MAVDADSEDLRGFLFLVGQKASQLAELRDAVGSPVAAVKYQHDVLFAPEIG